MKSIIHICLLISLLCSCQVTDSASVDDLNASTEQVAKILNQQQMAWNKGDIDGFMQASLKTEELAFIGASGITKGWQATLDRYKKSYPDKATMGRLEFEVLSQEMVSDDCQIMVGKYTLYREKDEPSGHFQLIWKKMNGNWVIVSDITCG